MRLKAEEVKCKSKILTVSKLFDTIIRAQPYRTLLSESEEIAELQYNAEA